MHVYFQIISIFTTNYYISYAAIGWGIWTGVVYASPGIVGLVGAFKPSKCILIAVLVMNIISSVYTICLNIIPQFIGIAISNHSSRFYREYDTTLALYFMMLIIGLGQAIVAIIAAGYSCSVVCCGQKLNHPGVIYTPNPNTITNSTFVEIPLNTPTATENGKMDQGDCPPNYEETCGTIYQRF